MVEAASPPSQQESLWLPPGTQPVVFDTFAGLNTNASRPGIEDDQMYWCDGWFPLGKNNLRILPGVGTLLYTAPGGKTITFFDFYNLMTTAYMVVFLSDGSAIQVNTTTRATTTIAPAGTFTNPSRVSLGITQWGSQYLVIVSSQTNGYFLWDGTLFYKAGTVAPNLTIVNGGSGYTSVPTVVFHGGSGSSIAAVLGVVNQIVTTATITATGSGYLAGDTVTATVSGGGGSGASISAVLMPFGVSGTAVESYTSRIWVANVATVTFSAPSSVSDFSTSDGGGNFTSNDSFLRVGFTNLKQTNGFLYLIADSSINYISGVQTSGSPPTTTFTNQNADPEIGTPYEATVDVFSRNILFANAFGVHVSYGGAVTKISEPLDGIFNTVANFGGFNLSAGKAIIFGKKVWMVLLPVIDVISKQQVNKLFLWNGKYWFSSQQDITLIYVQHQEINSVLTAFGTDGTHVYPLFQNPSTAFKKTIQSKLWSAPGYFVEKTESRLFGLVIFNSGNEADLSISIDNEQGISPVKYNLSAILMTWQNASGQVMTWENASSQPMIWEVPGIASFPPTAVVQSGVLAGMTITTSCDDATLISLELIQEIFQYRG